MSFAIKDASESILIRWRSQSYFCGMPNQGDVSDLYHSKHKKAMYDFDRSSVYSIHTSITEPAARRPAVYCGTKILSELEISIS